MKHYYHFLISCCFCLALSAPLKAQYYDQTMGVRAGTSLELSYKRFFFYTPKPQQALEILAGFQIDEGIFFPGILYDIPRNNGYVLESLWVFHLDIGFDTNFSAYAGAGGYLGAYTETGKNAFFGGGFTAVLGIEYTFSHAPVSVGLDWKPILGYPRFSLARGGVTLRYILPTTWQ
ncbi:MAG: hypothetical protein ACRBFS_12785 [Aureispira sp.]